MNKTELDMLGFPVAVGDQVAHLYKAGSSVGAGGPYRVAEVVNKGAVRVQRDDKLGKPMRIFLKVQG